MQSDADQKPTDHRLTVFEAAEVLGISPEAVRARIKRGTLRKDKGPDGIVYVHLDAVPPRQDGDETESSSRPDASLVEVLREQVDALRLDLEGWKKEAEDWKDEARRKDTIIMSLTQRIPELPSAAPQEAPGAPQADAAASEEGREGGQERGAQEGHDSPQRRRSGLMRFFFGP